MMKTGLVLTILVVPSAKNVAKWTFLFNLRQYAKMVLHFYVSGRWVTTFLGEDQAAANS